MNVKELRIGNYVIDNGEICEVIQIESNGNIMTTCKSKFPISNVEDLDPIELTEDLLLRIGFKRFREYMNSFDEFEDEQVCKEFIMPIFGGGSYLLRAEPFSDNKEYCIHLHDRNLSNKNSFEDLLKSPKIFETEWSTGDYCIRHLHNLQNLYYFISQNNELKIDIDTLTNSIMNKNNEDVPPIRAIDQLEKELSYNELKYNKYMYSWSLEVYSKGNSNKAKRFKELADRYENRCSEIKEKIDTFDYENERIRQFNNIVDTVKD